MDIKPELLKILACPVCKANVEWFNGQLKCLGCGEKFPVEQGIPIMLPKNPSDDLKLTINKWNDYYKKLSQKQIEQMKSDYKSTYLNGVLKYLSKFWVMKKGNIYLEIGCGPSFLGLKLAESGLKIFGLDVCIEAVKIAKAVFEREKREALFVCGDVLNPPFKNGQFDFIYGGGVIEHFKNTKRSIAEIYRILRKEGLAFNTVPYLCFGTLVYRQLWGNIPDFPVIKQIAEFFHIKIFKGKFMQFGYEKSFTMSKLQNMFREEKFRKNEMGLFDCFLPFNFIKSEQLKAFFRKLTKYKPFWPMIYVNAQK